MSQLTMAWAMSDVLKPFATILPMTPSVSSAARMPHRTMAGFIFKDAATDQGVELDICAYPVSELEERIQRVDVALLGPQVGCLKTKVAPACGAVGAPMDVIPVVGYGMCNGANVLKLA